MIIFDRVGVDLSITENRYFSGSDSESAICLRLAVRQGRGASAQAHPFSSYPSPPLIRTHALSLWATRRHESGRWLLGVANAQDQKRDETSAMMEASAPVFCILMLGASLCIKYNSYNTSHAFGLKPIIAHLRQQQVSEDFIFYRKSLV